MVAVEGRGQDFLIRKTTSRFTISMVNPCLISLPSSPWARRRGLGPLFFPSRIPSRHPHLAQTPSRLLERQRQFQATGVVGDRTRGMEYGEAFETA
jgi:hypothetical protein